MTSLQGFDTDLRYARTKNNCDWWVSRSDFGRGEIVSADRFRVLPGSDHEVVSARVLHSCVMNSIHENFQNQGLVRPREGRLLAGVVAGLGRRFGIDPWPARLLFVLVLLLIPGSQILVYPILWILMPAEKTANNLAAPVNGAPA
jgi:phage shock protein C